MLPRSCWRNLVMWREHFLCHLRLESKYWPFITEG
jgi:hypothetical protein